MHLADADSIYRQRPPRAFTLVEVLIATALLGIVASSSLFSLSQANKFAALSRLNTGAQVAAQNQIDLLVSTGPFNPQNGQLGAKPVPPNPIPAGWTARPVWTLGSITENNPGVIVYSEGEDQNGNPIRPIYGERTTTVKDTGSLNLYSATVEVKYTFRGKNYTVRLNAMRAADSLGSS